MAVLAHLQPQEVFAYFEELCAIPHGSGNTTAIADHLVAFAKAHGLEHYRDALNNVIIIKEATPGYENAEPVIIQGHTDMVCEKTAECTKDMAKEGLDLVVDGDTVYAEGTTLGGDDGIAVAMGMAILASKELCHPRVEVVLTVDEETGMDGARGLDVSPLKGRRMLNIDSEVEGIFTVSCAGGSFVECTLKVDR
ncbi:MAG: M20/M25/M40 family metallo-hydrolase, partial [Oscillospiraceae bacterium]|nr:M20/M25/M40 family metallo-hydrolase [Oscillospiraceae bacterium]